MPASPATLAPYTERIAFLTELAERLHAYGTTAQRLEGALLGVADRLGVECEPWVNPTGMILTFRDPTDLQPTDFTRVIRLPPGDADLSRLSRADRIAEDVLAGTMNVAEGRDALERIERPRSWRWRLMHIVAFAMVAGAVGCLLRLPWLDTATAAVAGLGIGVLDQLAQGRQRLREPLEALAGMLAAEDVGEALSLWSCGLQRFDVGAAVVVLADGDEFHFRRDDALPRVVNLGDVPARLGAQGLAVQSGEAQLVEFLVGGAQAAEF